MWRGGARRPCCCPPAARSWAGSLASVVASGLAAGTRFRCPGAAGPACSAVMRARVVSPTLRGPPAAPRARGVRGTRRAGAVSPGQAADPRGALEALIRQAGSVSTLARGQVAALDPEVVAAQLAEAEAARRR